jgi:hypothetical protein
MKISGFSFARNAQKLHYPIAESIRSILPICDEFVIAIGKGEEDDRTREEVAAIGSDKIRIIDTEWDLEKYPRGMEHAHQTDIARQACSGDWLFYVQADEVVHERYLPTIQQHCQQFVDDTEVEGFLFSYRHFWGDYDHYVDSFGWYPCEVRIVRNDPDIHSWESAQSFRRIPDFDGVNYRQQEGTFKLKVVKIDAYMYHYGWVRPPRAMMTKSMYINVNHRGAQEAQREIYRTVPFDYGPLKKAKRYIDTHPAVMQDRIDRFDWADQLNYSSKSAPGTKPHKHMRLKNRCIGWIHCTLFGGLPVIGFKNWLLLKR